MAREPRVGRAHPRTPQRLWVIRARSAFAALLGVAAVLFSSYCTSQASEQRAIPRTQRLTESGIAVLRTGRPWHSAAALSAFTGANHKDITVEASQTFLSAGTLLPAQLNIIHAGNWSVDDIQTYWFGQERHFTSSYFADGIENLANEWQLINSTDNQVTALLAFGRVLHGVQDFYSHSNWTELHQWFWKIPLWDLNTIPTGLWSGFWPDNDPSFARIAGKPNHHDSNKDSGGSLQGKKKPPWGPNRNRTYFDLAKDVATRATVEQFEQLVPILAQKTTFKIDDVITWPNGRAYLFAGDYYFRYIIADNSLDLARPVLYVREEWKGVWTDGIDASVTWTNGKVYFFKGNEYIRYDIAADAADAGYPRAISRSWRGLWSGGIDAAVNWGNGKVFFFKGDEYVRFDVAADRVDPGYPKKIAPSWPGLWSDGVDAAVNWGNGKVYFFRRNEYLSWDIASDATDAGFPRPLHGSWGGF